MKCASGHEVELGLTDCPVCGRRIGGANDPRLVELARERSSYADRTGVPTNRSRERLRAGSRAPRNRRPRWIVVAAVLVLIAIAVGGTAAAMRGDRNSAGAVVARNPNASPDDIRLGDCLSDFPKTTSKIVAGKGAPTYAIPLVPCGQAHLLEVYAVIDLNKEFRSFPGAVVVAAAVKGECLADLQRRVPDLTQARKIWFDFIYPADPGDWAVNRRAECLAYRFDKAQVMSVFPRPVAPAGTSV